MTALQIQQTTPSPLTDIGFQKAAPQRALQPFVASYWQISGYQSGPRQEYLHPDGRLGLVFNWGDSQSLGRHGNYVTGASFDTVREHSLALRLSGELQCFGVLLQPGVAFSLFGVPATEIGPADNLSAVMRQELQRLTEQMSTALDFIARINLVERWLLNLVATQTTVTSATPQIIQQLTQEPTQAKITQISEQCALSRRQIERLLKRDLGLSFKQYQNLQRIRRARFAIKASPKRALADIALDSGFYDQAHFNRVFSRSMGITPGHYRALATSQ